MTLVYLDANVLVPSYTRTLLMMAAPLSDFTVAWSLASAAQALRTDRIVQEIQAAGGDVRRISDLFGIGVDTAARYLRVLDPEPTELRR
ncbi:MAG: hypothetical protein QM602_04305 [Microbacterium sp.]